MSRRKEFKNSDIFADLPDFSETKVLVVGDIMLDSYWYGDIHRISPEAPVSVVKMTNDENRLGGAANVALNVSRIGAKCFLSGVMGHDSKADKIESLIENASIESKIERAAGSQTINKLRILSRNQQLIRIDFEDQFLGWNSEHFSSYLDSVLSHFDAVILSDYGKGTLRNPQRIIHMAKKMNKPVVVDPKGINFEKYRGATIITPNMSEFEDIVGMCSSEEEIKNRGAILRENLDLEALLVTRGEKGMTLFAKGQEPKNLATHAIEVFDVTGAGDTVIATIGSCLGAGVSLTQAVYVSNVAAGLVVGKIGTATVDKNELKKDRKRWGADISSWVDSEDEVMQFISKAKANGASIVMTNGCFDILHPGHVNYLEKARRLGDILVVAVNDDISVKRLKGDSRPLNPIDVRLKMLASLSSVDRVFSFTEDTPERIYEKFVPNILVKGGDYTEEEVVGADIVKSRGGKVIVIDFLTGFSTSDFISKVKNS